MVIWVAFESKSCLVAVYIALSPQYAIVIVIANMAHATHVNRFTVHICRIIIRLNNGHAATKERRTENVERGY